MPKMEHHRLIYRDKFRSQYSEAFQSWFEELVHRIHPAGDFQAIRKTQGDGSLDGFVISSQLVYAVYAPARMKEVRDSETAAKIHSDFTGACSTLDGQLKGWVFVHNHPEGKLGKLSVKAISDLKCQNPSVQIEVLNIDSLWEKLKFLSEEILQQLFGQLHLGATQCADLRVNRESRKKKLVSLLTQHPAPLLPQCDLSDFLRGFSRLNEGWFTKDAAHAIRTAIEYATKDGRGGLTTQHLLLGLLSSESGIAEKTVRFFGHEPSTLQAKLLHRIRIGAIVDHGAVKPSDAVKRLLANLWSSVIQRKGLLVDEVALFEAIISDEESRTVHSLFKFLATDRKSLLQFTAEARQLEVVKTDISTGQSM